MNDYEGGVGQWPGNWPRLGGGCEQVHREGSDQALPDLGEVILTSLGPAAASLPQRTCHLRSPAQVTPFVVVLAVWWGIFI